MSAGDGGGDGGGGTKQITASYAITAEFKSGDRSPEDAAGNGGIGGGSGGLAAFDEDNGEEAGGYAYDD